MADTDHMAIAPVVMKRTPSSSSQKSYDQDEKGAAVPHLHKDTEGNIVMDETAEVHGIHPGDPFPLDPDALEETHTLTLRALVVGSVLGAIVGASNIYLGLKTGFTFGPQLFGAIFGFAILKPLSVKFDGSMLPKWIWPAHFGAKENVTVQTAATAAGGIGIIFVSAVPAMYRLGLLSTLPQSDVGKLLSLTISCGFFGLFFAIPLRKYYILRQKLVFPTPTATAYTIRSLHNSKTGAAAAAKKVKGLLYSFLAAFVFKVGGSYAPGIITDWHVGWTLYQLGWKSLIQVENFGWVIEFTPAFYGAGMLSGMNASWSFFGGMILAWGIIAPSLIKTGKAVGIHDDTNPDLVSYLGLKFSNPDQYIHAPSPRYWLLWPGVLIMLVYSFTELFMNSRGAIFGVRDSIGDAAESFRRWRSKRRGDHNDLYEEEKKDVYDPTSPEDRVPWWAWSFGLVGSIIVSVSLCATQFGMNVGEVLLAQILGFAFSFIAVQSSGDTDINPVSTCAKASQLIFGGIAKGSGNTGPNGNLLNLVGGTLAAGAAAQSSDMVGDLKTGHLLSAKPRVQFAAQLVGSVVAVVLNVGLFILFTKSAPCILYPPPDGKCTYGAPSVSAWAAVSTAVLSPTLPIPKSSGFTAIGLAIASALSVVVKHLWVPRKYWVYIPNWNSVGLAFVVPQTYYATAMAFGATMNYFWERRNPKGFDMYGFPIAAGLLAGEGLAGVLNALFAVAGIAGINYGTAIGCPGFSFCG